MKKNLKEVSVALHQCINNYDDECIKELAQIMCNEHPTLQQRIGNLFIEWIKIQAERKYYDLRNECTVKMCKEFLEIIKRDFPSGLPMF